MSDPVIINCPKDVWTKIATNVAIGQVHKMSQVPATYLSTYRDTGGTAPDDVDDKAEGVEIFNDLDTSENISAVAGIDVYIMPVSENGSVRVDL